MENSIFRAATSARGLGSELLPFLPFNLMEEISPNPEALSANI